MPKLIMPFHTQEALRQFLKWFEENGEASYFDHMDIVSPGDESNTVAKFHYRPEELADDYGGDITIETELH